MARTKSFIAGVALVCVGVGLIGAIVLSKNTGLGESRMTQIDMNKTFESAPLNRVSLSSDITSVNVTKGSGSEVTVHLHGDTPEANKKYVSLVAETSGDTLNVRIETLKHNNSGLDLNQLLGLVSFGSRQALRIDVAVPDKLFHTLIFKTNTGRITAAGLKADSLSLQTDTGRVELDGFTGNLLDISTDTGSITVKNTDAAMTLKSDTGSIETEQDAIVKNITANTSTGRIEFLVKNPSPVRVDFRSDTGSTTADLPDLRYGTNEKHRLQGASGENGPLVRAESDTGRIELVSGQ